MVVLFFILFLTSVFIFGAILHVFVFIAGGRMGISQTIKFVMYYFVPLFKMRALFLGMEMLQLTGRRTTAVKAIMVFINLVVLSPIALGLIGLMVTETPGPTETEMPTEEPQLIEMGTKIEPSTGNVFSVAIVKGPVQDATINVYELNNDGTRGKLLIGPIKSDAFGNADLTLPAELPYRLLVEARGGTYTDEVNRAQRQLTNDDVMLTVLPAGIRRAAVTPFTHMAAVLATTWMQRGVESGLAVTQANIRVAQQYWLQSILEVVPVMAGSSEAVKVANEEERRYSALLAGLAQQAKDMNVRTIDLADALARDWSDGGLDGLQGGAQITFNDISGKTVALTANTGLNNLQAAVDAFLKSPNDATKLKELYIPLNPLKGNPDFAITTTVLPNWESGKYGAFTLTASGGKTPYIWTLKQGSTLPEGFTLSRDGVISGTSTLPSGTTKRFSPPFIVTVTDSSNPPNTRQIELRITIVQSTPKLTLLPAECIVNQKCSVQVTQATGGMPPYYFISDTFRVGAPPFGMIVNLNGVLTGTPKATGVYNFGVCVVDVVGASKCGTTTVVVVEESEITLEPITPEPTKGREFYLYVEEIGTYSSIDGKYYELGRVTSSPAGINCAGGCYAKFPEGTSVTLTATPDPVNGSPSVFTGWSGACSGTGPCVITMDSDKRVTATFDYVFSLKIQSTTCAGVTGSATGPVGATLLLNSEIKCGSWSKDAAWRCKRMPGQPPTTTWTLDFSTRKTNDYIDIYTGAVLYIPTPACGGISCAPLVRDESKIRC